MLEAPPAVSGRRGALPQDTRRTLHRAADPGQPGAAGGPFRRRAAPGRDAHEQLVVLAAGRGELERAEARGPAAG